MDSLTVFVEEKFRRKVGVLGETGVKRDGFCFPPISPKLIIEFL
jgi:hypothetical protein